MIYLMFLSALTLSASAAYYSIAGLVAIFSAARIPIIIMGSSLEFAKLVIASWIYRNWKQIPVLMKTYFVIALVILMCLTSMGIFGYLSKAHSDQAVPTGDVAAKLSLIDEKLNTEKETINEARKTLSQLDSQVDQTITRTANDTTDRGVSRSVSIRKSQAKERKELYSTIEASQAKIAKLNEEKAPIATELRKVEAEVGPIKYIAALIYGDQLDESFLEKAVRIVILLIVSVFDPLAVLMLIAANWSLKHPIKKDEDGVKEFFARGKELAKQLDREESVFEKYPYLTKPWAGFSNSIEPKLGWIPKETSEEPIETPVEKPSIINDAKSIIKEFFNRSSKSKTIEEEVEELQSPIAEEEPAPKNVEYDSVGRRITP